MQGPSRQCSPFPVPVGDVQHLPLPGLQAVQVASILVVIEEPFAAHAGTTHAPQALCLHHFQASHTPLQGNKLTATRWHALANIDRYATVFIAPGQNVTKTNHAVPVPDSDKATC